MRCVAALITVLLTAAPVAADEAIVAGAAVGAGGQGDTTYGALELGVDASWQRGRLGLAGRMVWLDGSFRGEDWDRASDAVRVLRVLEVATPGKTLALAAGVLAPARLAQIAEDYRATLDDHPRTGVRAAVLTRRVVLALELDDVIDPALAGGALEIATTPRWSLRAAAAVDPREARGATEVAMARMWNAAGGRTELGGGMIYELGFGAHAVAFARIDRDRAGARWSATADVRAGTGSLGAAFGPLYRLEREALWQRSAAGGGAGLGASVTGRAGWLGAAVRFAPVRGAVGSITAGAPMNRWLQAAGWVAASSTEAAGAAELRVAWATRLASALQVARMYDADAMAPSPAWSLTAWFVAATE